MSDDEYRADLLKFAAAIAAVRAAREADAKKSADELVEAHHSSRTLFETIAGSSRLFSIHPPRSYQPPATFVVRWRQSTRGQRCDRSERGRDRSSRRSAKPPSIRSINCATILRRTPCG